MGVHVSKSFDCDSPRSDSSRSPRNAKPSESDLEDDSDEDDEDPSTWFEDDQDDGIKFQNIVQPDSIEELSGIIRIDGSKAHYSSFYEPRDID